MSLYEKIRDYTVESQYPGKLYKSIRDHHLLKFQKDKTFYPYYFGHVLGAGLEFATYLEITGGVVVFASGEPLGLSMLGVGLLTRPIFRGLHDLDSTLIKKGLVK